MHFMKYLVAALALTSTFIHAMEINEGITVLEKDPYHTVTYTHGDMSLRNLTREADQSRLQGLITQSNAKQSELSSVKPYSLSSHTFYLNKAEERRSDNENHLATAFYGVISEASIEEIPEAFFALGTLPTIYETTDKPGAHKLLNELFSKLGLTKKRNLDDDFDRENMKVRKSKGLVAVAYGFHNDLYDIPEKIKAYWQGLIACVKDLKKQGEILPHPKDAEQRIPSYLTCIAPGYDKSMLRIMHNCGFTIYTPAKDHAFEDGIADYAAGIADFAPVDADRVFAVLNLDDKDQFFDED